MCIYLINKKTPDNIQVFGAEDGTRTRTSISPADFESAASANSATSA